MALAVARSVAVRAPTRQSVSGDVQRALRQLLRAQALNATRNVAALRPFAKGEFGRAPAAPSEAHIQAANALICDLRQRLFVAATGLRRQVERGMAQPTPAALERVLVAKEALEHGIKFTEGIWDVYLKLFGQRQTRFGPWLLAADRIALDCYQALYTGLSVPRSVPTPPPFAAMETGPTPSTFRRGIKLSKLGKRANPFPIVQLPYHRLVNPWTLGAVHHEVAHNLQSDLGLWHEVPRRVGLALRRAGLPAEVAGVWQRWHKEIWADLCAILLGGPQIVTSLMDVLARSPRAAQRFNPLGAHPTPYLRTLINTELLRQLDFAREARVFEAVWQRLYPSPQRGNIPGELLKTFPTAKRLVVRTLCFEPYLPLGNKALAEVVRFKPANSAMVREAAQRIAAGNDPGIIPERFLVAAARVALEQGYARPEAIRTNFYHALVRG